MVAVVCGRLDIVCELLKREDLDVNECIESGRFCESYFCSALARSVADGARIWM